MDWTWAWIEALSFDRAVTHNSLPAEERACVEVASGMARCSDGSPLVATVGVIHLKVTHFGVLNQ